MTVEKACTRMGREIADIDRAFDVQVRGVMVLTTRWDKKLNGMSAAWISRAAVLSHGECVQKELFS